MRVVSETLDNWRDYFGTSSSDIFDIIEHAIMVAASDCPQEFRIRRDRIAETLFSCKLAKCFHCDSLELAVPGDDDDDGCCCKGAKFQRGEFEGGGGDSKGSKANSCRDEQVEMNVNQVSNYSFGDAEALTDEIEEENQTVGEVLRIKEILDNCQNESVSVLFDSLKRLQLMVLSVDSLKATEIGKSVNAFRKHSSMEIRHLARTLIEVWKDMVDEWVNATTAVGGTEGTPESANPSVVDDEEGLPSPPLDEGAAFLATNTTIELSQFFDGIDDDGNPRNSLEFNRNRENDRRRQKENRNIPKQKPCEAYVPVIDKKGEEMKKQGPVLKKHAAVVKPNKPSFNTESGPGRSTKVVNVEQKVSNGTTFQQKFDKATTVQKKPLDIQQEKYLDDTARLDAAKRKLHERYQQAENAKRQRTIQVMELHDIPKQGPVGRRNANTRPGNHNRHGANGRR